MTPGSTLLTVNFSGGKFREVFNRGGGAYVRRNMVNVLQESISLI